MRSIVRTVALLLLLVVGVPAMASTALAAAPAAATASAPMADGGDDCSFLFSVAKKWCLEQAKEKKCKADPSSPDCGDKSSTGDPLGGLAASALNATIIKPMADGLGEFDAQLLHAGMADWLTQPSVSVANSGVLASKTGTVDGQTVTLSLQGICLGVGEMIAVLLVLYQSVRTVMQRKGEPLMQVFTGLMINALMTAMGVTLVDGLIVMSDKLTAAIIAVPFSGDDQLAKRMGDVLLATGGYNPMAQLIMAVVVLVVVVGNSVLMFLRQASIPVQALMLPIAGAGQIGGSSTRQWLPRLWSAMATVILYKPLAALLISAGFMEIGHGVSLVDWLRGVVTLVLSVIALPALMRLFAPFGMAMANATSGGFAGAMTSAAMMASASRGGSGGSAAPVSAVEHAQQMATRGPAAVPAAAASSAVQHAKQAATEGTSGSGNGGGPVPQQQRPGGDNSTPADGGSSAVGPQGQSPAQRGGNGVSVTLRTAETAARASRAAGNTVSEGSE